MPPRRPVWPGYNIELVGRRRRQRSYEEWSALRRWGLQPNDEDLVVGYALRAAREAVGLSQSDVAARLGCTQQAVSQAERWQSNPTIDFVRRWAAALGMKVELSLRRVEQRR